MRVKVTDGVSSLAGPSIKIAKHITTVPLFSSMAGMVKVLPLRLVPFSLSIVLTSSAPGKSPDSNPFTNQPKIICER